MATSRTGTASYRAWRRRVLSLARSSGLRYCPDCGRPLAWGTTLTPLSPEPDHIIPHALGGRDTLDNARVVCRECNQKRGKKSIPVKQSSKPRIHSTGILW